MWEKLKAGYSRAMDDADRLFDGLSDWIVIIVVFFVVLVGAGVDLAYWIGVTAAAWKYLVGG